MAMLTVSSLATPNSTTRSTTPNPSFSRSHHSRTSSSTPATSFSASQQHTHDLALEIEYLRSHLHSTQETLQAIYLDLEDSRARIAQDTVLIGGLQDKIVELEALVQKQKVTISNQSKTISDPRLNRKHQQQQQQQTPGCGNGAIVPMTPQRHAQGRGQCQGLSPFESPYSARSGFSGASGASGVGVEYLPPPPMFDVDGNGFVPMFPGQYQGQPSPAVNPLPVPSIWDPLAWSNGSPYTVAYLEPTACITEFSSRLRELWTKTELFGQVHANVPSVYKDSHLDKRVKEYIMSVSDRQGASSLLGSPATRFFLVAKAINAFLVHDVLKVTIIKGFDEQADMEIGGIKKQLFPGESLVIYLPHPRD